MILVYPYRLDGEPTVRERGERVRATLIRQAHALEPCPEWFRDVVKVRAAWWWARLGKGVRLTHKGIRTRKGRKVKLGLLPEVLT